MPGNLHHTMGQLEGAGALFLCAEINGLGVISTVSSPLLQSNDISCTTNATGGTTVSIKNFRGPRGFIVPVLTAYSASITSWPFPTVALGTQYSYSGDTVSFGYQCQVASNGTIAQCPVMLQVVAF